MAVDLITTPGADDANAYSDDDYVTALAPTRAAPGAVFLALSSDGKNSAIIAAATDIDALPLKGTKNDPLQAMKFPTKPNTTIPADILKANALHAIDLSPAYTAGAQTNLADITTGNGNVQELTAGPATIKYFKATATGGVAVDARLAGFSLTVARLLLPYLLPLPAKVVYGTGTAYRGS